MTWIASYLLAWAIQTTMYEVSDLEWQHTLTHKIEAVR
jgi:hypothetical protein